MATVKKATKATTAKTAKKAAPVKATTKAKKAEAPKHVEVQKNGFQRNGPILTGSILGMAFIALFITGIAAALIQSAHQYVGDDGKVHTYYHGDNLKGIKGFEGTEPSGGGLPAGYLAIFFSGIVVGILVLIGFAGGLRGSKGINRSNPYIKGQVYVRTKLQTVVFRMTTLVIAVTFLGSFFTDMFFGDVADYDSVKDPSSIFERIRDYAIEPGGYYQCFLSSLFLGFILLSKRYNGVKVIYPMAFIGAVRTFGDISDGAEKGSGTIVDFGRGTIEHMMLIIAPLFIIIAQRDRYTLRSIKQTVIYTFMMVFIAYIMITVNASMNKAKEIKIQSGGEIEGVAHGGKLGGATEDLQNAGLASHFHLFFGCMYVPFGIALVVLVIFNVNYGTFKAEAQGTGGKRGLQAFKDGGKDIKENQGKDFVGSGTFFNSTYRIDKRNKVAPFGVDPKVGEARKRK